MQLLVVAFFNQIQLSQVIKAKIAEEEDKLLVYRHNISSIDPSHVRLVMIQATFNDEDVGHCNGSRCSSFGIPATTSELEWIKQSMQF